MDEIIYIYGYHSIKQLIDNNIQPPDSAIFYLDYGSMQTDIENILIDQTSLELNIVINEFNNEKFYDDLMLSVINNFPSKTYRFIYRDYYSFYRYSCMVYNVNNDIWISGSIYPMNTIRLAKFKYIYVPRDSEMALINPLIKVKSLLVNRVKNYNYITYPVDQYPVKVSYPEEYKDIFSMYNIAFDNISSLKMVELYPVMKILKVHLADLFKLKNPLTLSRLTIGYNNALTIKNICNI